MCHLCYAYLSEAMPIIIQSYGLSCHVYADDIAIFTSFTVFDQISALNTINNCVVHVFDRLNSNYLRINPSKSKVLVCLPTGSDIPNNLLVGEGNIDASPSCYLGVIIDGALCISHIFLVYVDICCLYQIFLVHPSFPE